MRASTLITCLLLVEGTQCLFNGALKKLKQKAKNAYKKKFGKDKAWHFLGHDLTEYPGTNEKYRKMNKDKWDDYYACLLAVDSNMGQESSITPEAIQAYVSNYVSLECRLCLSPLESTSLDSVEWLWASQHDRKLYRVEFTENILLAPEDRTLRLFNLQETNTGQYLCRIGEAQSPPYFLTVKNIPDEDFMEVHRPETPKGPHPQPKHHIEGTNLALQTQWGPWGPCNRCGHVGKRFKIGTCLVLYEKELAPAKNNDIPREDLELLRIFKFGIPCKSHVLPKIIRRMPVVADRKNEIMSGYCRIECAGPKMFEVRDKNGKVIERVNNSAGIYSSLQGIPPAEPAVERSLQYAEKGKSAAIACPGDLHTETPVQWQIGGKNVVPELLTKESKGRVYVSITDKIHIKAAKISDTNIYSCWQQQELAGTVRLIVEKTVSLDFNHHIMLMGMVSISLVFLYIYFKAFLGRKVVRNVRK